MTTRKHSHMHITHEKKNHNKTCFDSNHHKQAVCLLTSSSSLSFSTRLISHESTHNHTNTHTQQLDRHFSPARSKLQISFMNFLLRMNVDFSLSFPLILFSINETNRYFKSFYSTVSLRFLQQLRHYSARSELCAHRFDNSVNTRHRRALLLNVTVQSNEDDDDDNKVGKT